MIFIDTPGFHFFSPFFHHPKNPKRPQNGGETERADLTGSKRYGVKLPKGGGSPSQEGDPSQLRDQWLGTMPPDRFGNP